MSKVVLTVGVSGSGKTTWARQFVADNAGWVITSRDDIRVAHGFPPVGEAEQEKIVTKLQRGMIEAALLDGYNVIVADTNLNKDIRNKLVDYVHKLGHDVEFKLFDVDLQTCIDRDAGRLKPVGEIVIRKQFAKWNGVKTHDFSPRPVPVYAPYVHGEDRTDVIVVDIDGTVAEGVTVRNMHDYTKVLLDLPRQDVIDIIRILSLYLKVVFVSGRKASCRADTEQWLNEYVGVPYTLYMRETDDERPDYIVKNEIYDEHLIPVYNIKMVFDDRNQVVAHLRARGISVSQVAPGRF
jgi:predicted kinase